MNGLTKTFLVLLRLAIGWHFLFEGWEKVQTYCPKAPRPNTTLYGEPLWRPVHPESGTKGKTVLKPWTSEAYLRGANGPLAGFFHYLAGDSILDQVQVLPGNPDERNDKKYSRLPEGLKKDWDAYFDRLVAHNHVEGEQLELMEMFFKQRKEQTVRWLLNGTMKSSRPGPTGSGTFEKDVKVAQEIQDYKDKRRQSEEADNPTDRDEARADAEKLGAELQRVVDEQTAEMRSVLEGKPTDIIPYKDKQPGPGSIKQVQKAEYGPLPEPIVRPMSQWDRLNWIDFATRWALVVIGVCLLAGLLTRTACVAGALFLLSLYVAMPPFPWLPPNPRAEGHYLYVNKNLIEMLALLALATTRSGRWLGLDSLFAVWRSRRRSSRPVVPPGPMTTDEVNSGQPRSAGTEIPARETPAAVAAPRSPYNPKEPTHGH
jgi:uncharacterized membrane protein YphA (DoxX/SURF4 family)